MANSVPGTKTCPICGLRAEADAGDEVVYFPPMFANQKHAVHVLNESLVHQRCLDAAPFGAAALRKLAAVQRTRVRTFVCVVCRRTIGDPDDFFGTGFLSDSEDEAVARLDNIFAHRSCLLRWDGALQLADDLDAVMASGEWEGHTLSELSQQLRSLASGAG